MEPTSQENLPNKQLGIGSANNLRALLKDYPLIRDLKNTVPIEQALAYCFILTGLKKDRYPDPLEKNVLIEFVRKYYPGLVAAEIKRAFDMACRGVFKDCETNHYQNFNCTFFGNVMSCYIDFRADELAQSRPINEWSQEEFDLLKDWNDRFFVPLENGTFEFSELDYFWYDKLFEIGIRCVPKEEMRAYGVKAESLTPMKKRKGMMGEDETKEQHNARIIKKAKCLAFEAWINEQQFNETDLRAMILPKIKP